MGAMAAKAVALRGDRVIMACRNMAKAEVVRRSIRDVIPDADISIARLNLSDMSSVRSFAAGLEGVRIDALFNNAGIINRNFTTTADGFENTLATNYLGPYLLTRLITGNMPENANIVNMVSLTCRFGKVDGSLFSRGPESFSQLGTYSDTKLALLLFSVALAGRMPGVHVNVADPGVVNSNMISMGRWFDPLADILFRPLCKSPEKGVAPALRALEYNGSLEYFAGRRHSRIHERYLGHTMVEELWNRTSDILKIDR